MIFPVLSPKCLGVKYKFLFTFWLSLVKAYRVEMQQIIAFCCIRSAEIRYRTVIVKLTWQGLTKHKNFNVN